MPTVDPAAVRDLVVRLNQLHDEYKSWRKVAREHYPKVAFGTLQRIAGGDYLPQDRKILRALGLMEPDEATAFERRWKRAFTRLLKALRYD
jgi:hypothetical protein